MIDKDVDAMANDEASVEQIRAELNLAKVMRIALKKRRLKKLMIGLIVISSAIIFVPKINKQMDERHKWNSEHSPNMAIIFEPHNYLKGVEMIRKIDKPYHQCDCASCKWETMTDGNWVGHNAFVITKIAESLLEKSGLRYHRMEIGHEQGCRFDSYDVAFTNFVNW